jgi:hypothetical protein
MMRGETIPLAFRRRAPFRFPTLALSRSGSTGMISGFKKPPRAQQIFPEN